jgi:dTDP-4-dehydrorhamnose 3,5-epimerase
VKISPTPLKDAWVIETEPFEDKRGRFARFFCWKELQEINKDKCLKQINYSLTLKKGAIRGMHFQYPPNAEVKFVRCLNGSVFDVIVDLRKGSETFLQWHGETLSEKNMKMLCIPEGFAHGFQTLEENCEMLYLHTDFYKPSHEGGLRYNDPKIGIKWPLEVTEISDRDRNHPLLSSDFEGITV